MAHDSARRPKGLRALVCEPYVGIYWMISVPAIPGCNSQKYSLVPLRVGMWVPLCSLASTPVVQSGRLLAVAVCGTMSRLRQTTVSPGATLRTAGWNFMPLISTTWLAGPSPADPDRVVPSSRGAPAASGQARRHQARGRTVTYRLPARPGASWHGPGGRQRPDAHQRGAS